MNNAQNGEYNDGFLVLDDGSIFKGTSIGAKGFTKAELCFNTTLVGYQETISDPSYAEQIIAFTMPHVGNIGINNFDNESTKIYAKGIVCKNYIDNYSHHLGKITLDKWLAENDVIGLTNVDTRAIVKKLRTTGTMNACIVGLDQPIRDEDIHKAQELIRTGKSIDEQQLAIEISTKQPYLYQPNRSNAIHLEANPNPTANKSNIVLIDFGYKDNIAKILYDKGFNIHILPAKSTYEEIQSYNPVGVVLSNGAGNPNMVIPYVKDTLVKLISADIPLLTICLGHQLLALSLGCAVEKLSYGHHGVNHPVKNLATNKIEITAQNHMYAVAKHDLPSEVEITHMNLFDDTVEGIKILHKPIISLQYHPESSAGPHDSQYNFDTFYELIQQFNKNKEQSHA